MKKRSIIVHMMAAMAMAINPGQSTPIQNNHQSVMQQQQNAALSEIVHQYRAPFNFLRGGGRRGRRKNRHCSFMGPGVRKKRTNKIHRSRMLKRKHAR